MLAGELAREPASDKIIRKRKHETPEMANQQFQISENSKDIGSLKLAVYGDNNGQKGLVRKVDSMEVKLRALLWICSAILLTMLGVVADKIF